MDKEYGLQVELKDGTSKIYIQASSLARCSDSETNALEIREQLSQEMKAMSSLVQR